MFVGLQQTSLDDKNRIILPARMRKKVEEASPTRDIVIVPWLDGCLSIYMPGEWEQMARKIQGNPYELAEARRAWRSVFPYAEEAAFDRQWRLLVPKPLLQRAGIEKELVIAGMYDHLELWTAAAWRQIEQQRSLEADIQQTYDRRQPPPAKT